MAITKKEDRFSDGLKSFSNFGIPKVIGNKIVYHSIHVTRIKRLDFGFSEEECIGVY